jgi:hypothetical protein
MLVTGRKIRAQSVVLVQHSGWGSWEAWNDWAGLRVLRRIPSACHATITTTEPSRRPRPPGWPRKRAYRGFASRLVAVRWMGVTRVTTPPPERPTPSPRRSCDAHLSHRRASPCRHGERLVVLHQKKPPPSTRPGGVRVAKCLPVNRDTRNVPPLRPARYPQTRAVADKKRYPARRTWATQVFQSPSLVVEEGETQRCRRSASREEDVLRVYA